MNNKATTNYRFRDNQEIEITLGYKTMGTLNENKDNVILVCHSFSSNSNFAGEDNKGNIGYWNDLIGENKAIDTNKYFVISFDNLSNVQLYNDYVTTTGPRTYNKNNERYNMSFPIFTFKDIVKIQYKLLSEEFKINHLEMVIGASAGGCTSWHWAVEYPEFVSKVVPLITNIKTCSWTRLMLLNTSIKALENDAKWCNGNYEEDNQPKEGLALGVSAMNCVDLKKDEYEKLYQDNRDVLLNTHDDENPVVRQMYQEMTSALEIMDPLHYYYMCKAMMQYDVSEGYSSVEKALARIEAEMLIISCKDDQIFPCEYNQAMYEIMKKLNKKFSFYEYEHQTGHMSDIKNVEMFDYKIKELLEN